jgi:hypothetical protein
MSNKSSTATEPNKPGLPESPERGIGETTTATPAVAGTGPQGAFVEEAKRAEGAPKKSTAKPGSKEDEKERGVGIAWFRVKGPGSVKVNGAWYPAGAELQITRTEALSVDEYLEEIDSPS